MGESPDIIDYTALERRGIIKKKESKRLAAPVSKDGFIDFSVMGQDKINSIANSNLPSSLSPPSAPSSPSSSPTPSFSNFWNDLPGQNTSPTTTTAATPSQETSYYSNPLYTSPVSDNSSELSNLKVKLDDLEYKLARLAEKLDALSSKGY